MDKRIVNVSTLKRPNGKPYMLPAEPPEREDEREGTLAEWIDLALNQIPVGNLVMRDNYNVNHVLEACFKAKDQPVLILRDDTYDWLIKVLFDDEEGKRLSMANFSEGRRPIFSGGFMVNKFGFLAATVKQALETFEPEPEKSED